jgi:hypothetical protein
MKSVKHFATLVSPTGILILFLFSCKKFVQIPEPNNQIVSSTVFLNDKTATAAITGIYSQMMATPALWSAAGIPLYTGLSSDELFYNLVGITDEFQKNQLTPSNANLSSVFWTPAYNNIYTANLCIEELNKSGMLKPDLKQILLGEAHFIRAFAYFYLVNLFGEVPLITTSNYVENASLKRSPVSEVYNQMVNDLKKAQEMLTPGYVTIEKNRPNRHTATALLCRVYLFMGDWTNAEAQANDIISSGAYSMTGNTAQVFQKNSSETIWQLPPVDPGRNTWLAYYFIPGAQTMPTYPLTKTFLSSFENNDKRFENWVGKKTLLGDSLYYPKKYSLVVAPPVSEHYIVLRLAEIYLIRAEARARLNKVPEARADMNIIRTRAGLAASTSTDRDTILNEISKERRIELFCEWGDRWFDLKRTGKITQVLGALKPQTWQNSDTLYPIPLNQILLNPNLTQNAGY